VHGCGEHARIRAGFGDEYIGDDLRSARDAHQQLPDGSKGGNRLLDTPIQAGDVSGMGIDAIKAQPRHERMMLGEPPAERLGQRGNLRPQPSFGQIGRDRRIRAAAISASSIARPDTPTMLEAPPRV
jgi:hypothetical protein